MIQEILLKEKSDIGEGNVFNLHDPLLYYKKNWMRKGVVFPDQLIDELEAFRDRNTIALTYDVRKNICCPQCLKAHTLKKAMEAGLDPKVISLFSRVFEGEIGHDGYYLDKENLIKM